LTESPSISKIPNRRGFQSNWDFLAGLEIRGPGDPLFGKLGVWNPSFYINPSRRVPAPGFWKRRVLGPLLWGGDPGEPGLESWDPRDWGYPAGRGQGPAARG